jgi:CRISPR-associated protein Cmr2
MVYSGGDDILALLPAATAVRALQLCIEKVRTPDLMGPDFSMSASLLIFPHTDSLSGAIREGAHLMRAEAKNRFNRGSVVITSRRQSGKKTMAALPWLAGTESSLSALNLLINAMAAEPSKQHAISGRIVGQFAELEPGLHGVQPLSVAAMAQSLLKRHSNASKDSKEFADQSKAIEVLADAAYEMAKKTHHEFPQASLLLETLIMARFLSRPSEGQ